MNLGKINFFKRIYLAITDFRMYPYTQKEKASTAIGYFIKLLIFAAIVLSAFVTRSIFKEMPVVMDIYNQYLPDFEINNGVLNATENIEKEINDDYYLIVNSDYNYENMENINMEESDMHSHYILVLSDATVLGIRMNDGIHELGAILYESNMNFTKEQLLDEWKIANDSVVSKIFIWLGMTIGILIIISIIRIWTLIMYILSAYIINFMFGLKLKFMEYIKLVIYSSTLPLILEIIAILLVGNISETISFLSTLISCVYIFYALRAIKLDSLILGGSGKTAEEKIKSALANAQKELDKQLEELEKKEKDNKENEKKEIEVLNTELKEKEENLIKAQKEYDDIIKKVMQLSEDIKKQNKDNESQK